MDHEFFERNQSVVREKVPERLVHAKGMSVKGYFIAENSEMDKYTSAKFLHKSDYKTPVVCRFSTTSGSLGSADAVRDTHGMGVRFYNKHSGCNVDFVALHLPVFAIYDAMKFASKVHSGKPDPKTGISTPCSGLDFFSQTPESSGAFVMNYSDRGIPRSWRHIDGYSVNTFKLRNNKDEVHYCRWEFDTLEGTQFLTNEQARALAVKPDAFH
jgi:catalase